MITDLGPDFRKKKGAVLYSGCSCTCCCCCVHTVVSSFFFARAFSKASGESASRDLGFLIWTGCILAPILAWIFGLYVYGIANPRSDPAMVSFWTFLFLGPIVLPLLALVSWIGGIFGAGFGTAFFGWNFEVQMQGLNAVYYHYLEAFFDSIIWTVSVVLVCWLALMVMSGKF